MPQKVDNEFVRMQRKKNLNEVKHVMQWNNEKSVHDGLTNHIIAESYNDLPGFLKRKCDRSDTDDSTFLYTALTMVNKTLMC